MDPNPLKTKVVVEYAHGDHKNTEEFTNARVTIQPPFIIVSNDTEQLGFFPIGVVSAVLFPEGSNKVSL